LASGKEGLGFCADEGKFEVDERIEERDLIFYKNVENEGYITALPGCYSIFYPNDVHRPSILIDDYTLVRKVVVKVSLELL
jgi:YhcH/YjgK/YiaL family protein